jgi:hypothetical protein
VMLELVTLRLPVVALLGHAAHRLASVLTATGNNGAAATGVWLSATPRHAC